MNREHLRELHPGKTLCAFELCLPVVKYLRDTCNPRLQQRKAASGEKGIRFDVVEGVVTRCMSRCVKWRYAPAVSQIVISTWQGYQSPLFALPLGHWAGSVWK